jgi:high-affinity nickel-transport protein
MEWKNIKPNRSELIYITIFIIINIIITSISFISLLTLPQQSIKLETESGVIFGTLFTLGILAYTLGLRHAVDADHLAAIDNATRKLIQEGKRPFFAGTFFSLGHSTVVILVSVVLMISTRYILENLPNFESFGNLIGPSISASFLYIISFMNLIILYELFKIYKNWRKMNEKVLEEVLMKRGFMNRALRYLFKIVSKDWHMYPIGLLFGLGFDTASQIATYGIAVALTISFAQLPIFYIILFPLLFTCGMTLVDTLDGIFMTTVYGWAFTKPLSKLWYNITMTFISIIIGFIIGSIEYLGIISSELGFSGGFWDFINSLDFEVIGYIIIGTFGVTWLSSWILYNFKIKKLELEKRY